MTHVFTPAAMQPVPTATVRTAARIHLGLFALPSAEKEPPGDPAVRPRIHGGLGFMVERPGVAVRVSLAASISSTARDPVPVVDAGAVARCEQVLRRCEERLGFTPRNGLSIEVLESPRAHVGLGSGTQLALATAAACAALARASGLEAVRELDDVAALAELAGRGLRSSVGIHGFAQGGLLLEAGHGSVLPDGDRPRAGARIGPLVARVPLPEAWRFVLAIPGGSGLHGDEERAAFARLSGIPRALTAELARIAVLEVIPAAVERDLDAFASAITRYGRLAGEPYEPVLASHPLARHIADTIAWMESHGARGAAQTSWGPAVITCLPTEEAASALVSRLSLEAGDRSTQILVTAARNRGASVTLGPA